MTDGTTRRNFLRAGAAAAGTATIGGLAGCGELSSMFAGEGDDLATVPASAQAVAHVDVDALETDPAIKRVTNAWLDVQAQREGYSGPESYEDVLAQIEAESNLDPTKASAMTLFSEYGSDGVAPSGQGISGVIVEAEWTESELVSAQEAVGANFTESTYSGTTVYRSQAEPEAWIGVLSAGTYALGTEQAVKAVIDVSTGDAEGIGTELKEVYEQTRAAPVRFAATLPDEQVPDGGAQIGAGVDLGILEDVSHVSGSLYRDGEKRGVEVTFVATDGNTATDLKDTIEGGLAFAEQQTDDEQLATALDEMTVSQDGNRVSVGYAKTVDELVAMLEAAANQTDQQP